MDGWMETNAGEKTHVTLRDVILTLLAPSAGWQLPAAAAALWPPASCSLSLSTSLWASSALCAHTAVSQRYSFQTPATSIG